MKAWIFVEGPSDRAGLEALWKTWRQRLQLIGRGIAIIPLRDKANYLIKIGERTAEKLVANEFDVVVGMPDLYPISNFGTGPNKHTTVQELKSVQAESIRRALRDTHHLRDDNIEEKLKRFYPSVFKHDFEMLLLAARDELRAVLGTQDLLRNAWREPVEMQNMGSPPKRVVEELFRTKSPRKQAYRDTRDAPAVLGKVGDVARILKTTSRQCTCPEFASMLAWLGERLGDQCCSLD